MVTPATTSSTDAGTALSASARLRVPASRVGLYGVALVLSLAFIVPFFWTISISLKQIKELFQFPPLLFPEVPQWGNYVDVWTRVPFGQWVVNTFIIAGSAVGGTLFTSSLVAYSFARYRYPGRDLFFMVTLSTMMLPAEVTIIPQYLGFRELGMLDTLYPLIIPSWLGGGAFYVFLLRQFFLGIPNELWEASQLDGASHFTYLSRVVVPLSTPALLTVGLYAFVQSWKSFLWPLVMTSRPEVRPIQVGLSTFALENGTYYHTLMAASAFTIAPVLILFILVQRQFLESIARSGLKG